MPPPTFTPLDLSFNADCSYFSISSNLGLHVYECDTGLKLVCRRDMPGGMMHCETLHKTAILALVGPSPTNATTPTSDLMIWDEAEGRCIGEITCRAPIRAVRLRRDRIAVALELKTLVYQWNDLSLLHNIETSPNITGLVALSTAPDRPILVTRGMRPGQVRIEDYALRLTRLVDAHQSSLRCLALSSCGRFLATASERGTVVRLFGCGDGRLLRELRRGKDPCVLYSLAFSRNAHYLACSSDKGTVHVWCLRDMIDSSQLVSGEERRGGLMGSLPSPPSTTSLAPPMTTLPPPPQPWFKAPALVQRVMDSLPHVPLKSFEQLRSCARYKLPVETETMQCKTIVGFGEANADAGVDGLPSVLVVSSSGYFYRLGLESNKSKADTQQEVVNLVPLSTLHYPDLV